jgi:hypothetical protein
MSCTSKTGGAPRFYDKPKDIVHFHLLISSLEFPNIRLQNLLPAAS